MQNDEYIYYGMVEQFLKFDFRLDPYLGATFYTQGILGAVFTYFFGIGFLPVLTLTLTVFGCFTLSLILKKFFSLTDRIAFLLGFLTFLNPLSLYSTWGFMSENYYAFFLLVSIYFYFSFVKSPSIKNFIIFNVLFILSYGVRQFGLAAPLAVVLDLLLKRKHRWAIIELFVFILTFSFHYTIFPRTPFMYDEVFNLNVLKDVDGLITRVYIFGIYVSVFIAPVILWFIYFSIRQNKKILLVFLFAPVLFYSLEKKFEPENVLFTVYTRSGVITNEIISPKFPYLGNIFTRKGFYEDNLPGDKYTFPGYFDLFNTFEIVGKSLFVLLLLFMVVNFKVLEKFTLFYAAILVFVLLISPRLFDRYLLPLIPLLTISIASTFTYFKNSSKKYLAVLLTVSVGFWIVLGYQFSMDFILVNKYIWNSANNLVKNLKIDKNKISVDNAWNQLYPNRSKDKIYFFTYSDFDRATNSNQYSLIDVYQIKFPCNFYKNPYIYTYHKSIYKPKD